MKVCVHRKKGRIFKNLLQFEEFVIYSSTFIFRQKLRKLDNHHHFALALTSAKIMSDKTCSEKYPSCATSMAKPDSYRNVALDHANVEEMRVTEALEAFNKVRHQWSGLRTH